MTDARRLAEIHAAIESGVPFSLACTGCDDGQQITDYESAVAAGWDGISFDVTGLGWNFVGTCPECKL